MISNVIYENLVSTDMFEYNDFFNSYYNLIIDNLDTECIKNKTEKHHIIPRYYFKANNIEIDNSNTNLVNLSYKDHLLAHYYLTLCSKGGYKNSNFVAVLNMVGKNVFSMSLEDLYELLPEYERLKEQYAIEVSRTRKGIHRSVEAILKGVETRKGYKHSDITIEKIRNSSIGKVKTEESKLKMSISHKNKNSHWYTNGRLNMLLEESAAIPEGFYRGKTVSNETKEKLSKSQQKRFKHNHGTMLGKHLSYEQRQKCSDSHKGISMSSDTKNKLSKTLTGSKIYNNGTVSIRVLANELPPEGFVRGRLKINEKTMSDDLAIINNNKEE